MTLPALGVAIYAASAALSAILIPLLRKSAMKTGFYDRPGLRKDHSEPIPAVGGIAILFGVSVPATLGLGLAIADAGTWLPEAAAAHLPGIRTRALPILAILCGAGALLVTGYMDDRKALSPWLRLGIQVICALAASLAGVRATLHLPAEWMHHAASILFIVAIVNGTNFLDNMNGLCGSVLLIACLGLLMLATASGQFFVAAMLLAIAGSLSGFLLWNFPDARVFLGDSGSTSLGYLAATTAILLTYDTGEPSLRPWLIPALAFAVTLADTATVVASRLRRGVHPFTAGKDHLSHRLAGRGHSKLRAVLILAALQAAASGALAALASVPLEVALPCAAPALAIPLLALAGRLRIG